MFARFIMDRKVVAIILGVALVLGAYLWMCVPHPESVNAPLTLSEAKARFSVLSSLPATAHDIYFAVQWWPRRRSAHAALQRSDC